MAEGRENHLVDARCVQGQPPAVAIAIEAPLPVPPSLLQQPFLLAWLSLRLRLCAIVIPCSEVEPAQDAPLEALPHRQDRDASAIRYAPHEARGLRRDVATVALLPLFEHLM
jgi:hypothetical protein